MRIPNVRGVIAAAPMSTALIIINVLIFVAINLDGRLVDLLALPPNWEGVAAQPWTLLTVFFTSEVIIHIAVAVLVIGLFGPRIERLVGSVHVLGVYLLAGLSGSLALVATAAATGFDEPSVGASAAFLGLVGALAVWPRSTWWDKLPLDKAVAVVVVVQVAAPFLGIGDWFSSAAHIVGLGTGAAYGYLLRSRSTTELPDATTSNR